VFVRKKSDPSVPYITCDILANDYYYGCGKINQYLIHHNNSPKDENALAFKGLFQQHLIANWNKG
jgi:hypothetical protein